MKKLIITTAIVCVAVMSHAAQFQWKAANVKDITGADKYSGAATLYLTDTTTGQTQTYNGTMSSGAIAIVIGDGSAANAGFIVTGDSYSAYYTMTDAQGNIFTSTTKSGLTPTYPSAGSIGFLNGGSWSAAPVPEPTSGFLLLLGVAGLALRRKRA